MKKFWSLVVCGAVVAAGSAGTAQALPPFKKAFEDLYVKDSGNDTFKAEMKKASCNACHVKGEKKDVQNAYGKSLSELIEGNAKTRLDDAKKNGMKDTEEKKLMDELAAAFKKAEAMKADASDPASKTYGELIKEGKLPVGQ